ncbi:hypothetical protein [Nocardia sp. NBC_00416]|uniref:hypothetical protein n=1 Tax=Nocardia sp. NBC_00416 TaxID=2975991 RepID=UPI002E1F1179
MNRPPTTTQEVDRGEIAHEQKLVGGRGDGLAETRRDRPRRADLPYTGQPPAPVAANPIVQPDNSRLQADLEVPLTYPAEIVITSVDSPAEVIGPLHDPASSDRAELRGLRFLPLWRPSEAVPESPYPASRSAHQMY